MIKILEYSKGIDKSTSFSFVTNEQEGQYIAKQYAVAKVKGSVKDLLPKTSAEALDILSQMLELNPYLRPSAETLLGHKIFEKIRDPTVEIKAPHKIILNADFNEF